MTDLLRMEAVVVGVRDLGEADRIVTLLSPGYGLRRSVARGSRRPRSRLAAGSQLFTLASFTLNPGRELDTVTGVEIRDSFQAIGACVERTAVAAVMCEVGAGFSSEHEPAADMFHLLVAAMTVLARGADPIAVLCRFLIRAVTVAGVGPVVDRCVVCGRDLDRPILDPERGGLVCAGCPGGGGRRFSAEAGDALGQLAGADRSIRVDRTVGMEVLGLLTWYVSVHLDRPVRSTGFLYQVLGGEKGDMDG